LANKAISRSRLCAAKTSTSIEWTVVRYRRIEP
jgi:hypothetical protein